MPPTPQEGSVKQMEEEGQPMQPGEVPVSPLEEPVQQREQPEQLVQQQGEPEQQTQPGPRNRLLKRRTGPGHPCLQIIQ